jgi:phosphoribosyl 1,2-cyclic phosphodiesterase
VEVVSGTHRLILDAGTGVRGLGDELLRAPPVDVTFLFSHLHWDHVQGFPFFAPAWAPTTKLALFGPGADGDVALRSALSRQMEPPTFPVPLAAMRAQMDFRPAIPGRRIERGPFVITPVELPHPQGCVGYVIEADGARFAYCTDVELTRAGLPPSLGDALEGVDALVLDAQYTREEYDGRRGPPRKGWGHSTNVDAADIASALAVRKLLLFHHDPGHADATVEAMADEARQVFSASAPAREGATLSLECA